MSQMKVLLGCCVFASAFQISCSKPASFGTRPSAPALEKNAQGAQPAGEQNSPDSKGVTGVSGDQGDATGKVSNPGSSDSQLSCTEELLKVFGGFSIKGGKKVQVVSAQTQMEKGYLVTFGNNSPLSYSNGSIESQGNIAANIVVPSEVSLPSNPSCKSKFDVLVQPDDTFVTGTVLQRGFKGNLYQLPEGTKKLPDLSKMTSIGKVYAENLDVPDRAFELGFPGVAANLIEWFAIDFTGKFVVPSAGTYMFKVSSDDGAIVDLNGIEIINNDGTHAVTEVASGPQNLTIGEKSLRVRYFQGPRVRIALQLYFKGPGDTAWKIVPQSMMKID